MTRRLPISSEVLDTATGIVLAVACAVGLWATHGLDQTLDSIAAIGFCALVAVRRRQPVLVTLAASGLLAVSVASNSLAASQDDGAMVPVAIAFIMFSFTLGETRPLRWSLLALTTLIVVNEFVGGPASPLPAVLGLGAFVASALIGSRRRTSALLRARAAELEEEETIFVRESVRRERTRIAHELHDIVAHCISLMVVQADAGQRIAEADPQGAAEALQSIAEAARQAGEEIDRLIEFLDDPDTAPTGVGVEMLESLAERVRSSGATVSCRLSGELEQLSESECELVYRVVQEALTNAIKHAPGAKLEVSASVSGDEVAVQVENGAASARRIALASTGGGNGLVSMRQRVEAAGGTFSAGPAASGGWVVRATVPVKYKVLAGSALTEVR